eukprot:m51a1_g1446 putative fatty-acid- ligase fadd9 (432) ;mRNA; f:138524-142008
MDDSVSPSDSSVGESIEESPLVNRADGRAVSPALMRTLGAPEGEEDSDYDSGTECHLPPEMRKKFRPSSMTDAECGAENASKVGRGELVCFEAVIIRPPGFEERLAPDIVQLAQGELVPVEHIESVLADCPLVSHVWVHAEATKTAVSRRVLEDLERLARGAGLAEFMAPRPVFVEHRPFTVEGGLLSPTLMLRRRKLRGHYLPIRPAVTLPAISPSVLPASPRAAAIRMPVTADYVLVEAVRGAIASREPFGIDYDSVLRASAGMGFPSRAAAVWTLQTSFAEGRDYVKKGSRYALSRNTLLRLVTGRVGVTDPAFVSSVLHCLSQALATAQDAASTAEAELQRRRAEVAWQNQEMARVEREASAEWARAQTALEMARKKEREVEERWAAIEAAQREETRKRMFEPLLCCAPADDAADVATPTPKRPKSL